ncbi:MAG: helix-turn-helix domain-containing protein [Caldimonas sp.]
MSTSNFKAVDSAAEPAQQSIGSRYVRALLNRHEIPSSRHVTTIAQVVACGHNAAYRRLNGGVAWEIEEIEKLAQHFGESLAEAFGGREDTDAEAAVLVAGGHRVPCELVVGDPVRERPPNTLVAVKAGEQWLVMPSSEGGVGPVFEVKHMTVSSRSNWRPRVAILDDDQNAAAGLAEFFSDQDCEVQAFSRVQDLVAHMKARPFDGYVLDWVLAEGSADEVIGMIHAEDPGSSIAILTGRMMDDVSVGRAVSQAISTYQLQIFQKPTPPLIIWTSLKRSMAKR